MEGILNKLTRYSPLSEYFAIQGTFESSHGLSPKGRWYGAVLVEGRLVRTILDGQDALLAQAAASKNDLAKRAEPNPLVECVTTGGMADFTGASLHDESYNDNYEQPSETRERTAHRHADGTPVIWRPPFGPVSEDPEDAPSGWKSVSIDGGAVIVKSDGGTIHIVEVTKAPDEEEFGLRSSRFPLADLDKFDEKAAEVYGITRDDWARTAPWMRAYAKLLYYGPEDHDKLDSMEEALTELTGSSEMPPRL